MFNLTTPRHRLRRLPWRSAHGGGACATRGSATWCCVATPWPWSGPSSRRQGGCAAAGSRAPLLGGCGPSGPREYPRFPRSCRPKPCRPPSRRNPAASRRDGRRQPLRWQGRRRTAVPPLLRSGLLRSAVSAWPRGIAPRPQTAATQTAGTQESAVPPLLRSKTLPSAVSAQTRRIAPRRQTADTRTAGAQEHRGSPAPAVWAPAVCGLGVDPRPRAETADGSHSDGM